MTSVRAPVVTETTLLNTVVDMCQVFGLLVHHCRPARTAQGWRTPIQGDAGFPDLIIAGPGGTLYRELKDARGRLSPDQRLWLDRLQQAGANADLWRPSDLASGRIETELRALRGRP